MLNKIIRMLQSRCYEFVLLFMFNSVCIFIHTTWFLVNAICVTILCILYIPLVTFVVPTLPMWYRKRIGDIPKFNAVQAVLCICYCASAWAPALWKVG